MIIDKTLANWPTDAQAAITMQRELAPLVVRQTVLDDSEEGVRLVAGIDMSANSQTGMARAAVVILSYPALEVLEIRRHEEPLRFPYVPGLLSFREIPVILEAYRTLEHRPDLLVVDGQGIAHPRRLGIAAHLGVLLDRPALGCAKSILCGKHESLPLEPGVQAPLIHRGEIVGMAVRTKIRTNPVFISIGHRLDLESAVMYALTCCRGYRLPEPIRQAHNAAGTA